MNEMMNSLFILFGIRLLEYSHACRCGEHSGWTGWEKCSKTCDGGKRINRRQCNNEWLIQGEIRVPCFGGPGCEAGWRKTGRKYWALKGCLPGKYEQKSTQPCNPDPCRKF